MPEGIRTKLEHLFFQLEGNVIFWIFFQVPVPVPKMQLQARKTLEAEKNYENGKRTLRPNNFKKIYTGPKKPNVSMVAKRFDAAENKQGTLRLKKFLKS